MKGRALCYSPHNKYDFLRTRAMLLKVQRMTFCRIPFVSYFSYWTQSLPCTGLRIKKSAKVFRGHGLRKRCSTRGPRLARAYAHGIGIIQVYGYFLLRRESWALIPPRVRPLAYSSLFPKCLLGHQPTLSNH